MPDEPANAHKHERNLLDFIRLALASLVIFSHAFALTSKSLSDREPPTGIFHTITFGELAVDGFFVISGYLITISWLRTPFLFAYFRKRILRIYPGYAMAMLVSVLIVGALGAASATTYLNEVSLRHLAKQIVLLRTPTTPPVFTGIAYPVVNGALWTIKYEFLCYIFVALLGVLGLLRYRLVPFVGLAGLTIAYVVVRLIDGRSGDALPAWVSNDIRFFMIFFGGMVFAYLPLHLRWKPLAVAAAVALCVLAMFSRVLIEPVVATAGAFALLSIGYAGKRHLPFRKLPDVSYGVYLYGWPVEMLVVRYGPSFPAPLVFLLSLVVSVALGALSWYCIERPALRIAAPA